MKKKTPPTFDELKNPQYSYHYSREERLSRRRHVPETEKSTKWYYRVVGNNRTTLQLLIFYILLAVAFWFFWFALRGQGADKRVFRITPQRSAEVRWIENDQKRGWNILLDNASGEAWRISLLTLFVNGQVLLTTNVATTIEGKDFVVWFFPWQQERPVLNKLNIKIEE